VNAGRALARDDIEEACRASAVWFGSRVPHEFRVASSRIGLGWSVDRRERELVAQAVSARQADFVTGRWCAHRVLEAIGRNEPVLAIGRLGGPDWPSGVVGSISHDDGMCVAVAGPGRNVRGIGIDVFGLSRGSALTALAPLILSEAECLRQTRDAHRPSCVPTLFCIKEAVIKAVSPTVQRVLDPRVIEVRLDADRFEATVEGLPDAVEGWHGRSGQYLLALALHRETGRYAADNKPN
jgi:4'-phosphopantetheinyl transferase EntD